MNKKSISGFTLIELSVVLIIIGLIAGGILVGGDLIRAAEIRAQISQIEKYNTAVYTFKLKFQVLPGDMTNDTANALGFSSTIHNGTGAVGQGDGNGVIDGDSGVTIAAVGGFPNQTFSYPSIIGESGVFWSDLSSSAAGNLIEGSFSSTWEAPPGVFASGSDLSKYLPAAALGAGNYVYVFEINSSNYFGIMNVKPDMDFLFNGGLY